jgi:hypothetical protein
MVKPLLVCLALVFLAAGKSVGAVDVWLCTQVPSCDGLGAQSIVHHVVHFSQQ